MEFSENLLADALIVCRKAAVAEHFRHSFGAERRVAGEAPICAHLSGVFKANTYQ